MVVDLVISLTFELHIDHQFERNTSHLSSQDALKIPILLKLKKIAEENLERLDQENKCNRSTKPKGRHIVGA